MPKLYMKMKVLPAIIMSALAAWPQNQPEVSSEDNPITFSSRVNLVSVPVVVRDRAGRAVGNLTREDFQLFDKGKLQLITKFSMEKSDSAANTAGSATAPREAQERAVTPVSPPAALPDR